MDLPIVITAKNCEIIQTLSIVIEAAVVVTGALLIRESRVERELKKIDDIIEIANNMLYRLENNTFNATAPHSDDFKELKKLCDLMALPRGYNIYIVQKIKALRKAGVKNIGSATEIKEELSKLHEAMEYIVDCCYKDKLPKLKMVKEILQMKE